MLEGRWDDPFLEKEVAAELGIPYHPGGTGKPPNDLQQVRDLFHVWSRKAFAGIKKTDVDLVLLSDKNDARVLVEVKRSAKKKVGEWIPYPIDPYDGLAYFARTWGAKLVTVHHEIIGGGHAEKPSPENILVDVFAYDPRSPFDFASFACENNRRVTTLDELVVELKSLLEQ
ncbi:hypothetical protein GCM10007092_20530 [Thermus composti]|uniref:Uncharacterized protein n=2 Tax=Thermus TaxID=270 RepID=A0ABV6Q0L2_9DEIN|nr:hypothetical protein [Thermus composti]GGN05643.1 hypothetical protein GCM10007092_20530 [Thermus composti]